MVNCGSNSQGSLVMRLVLQGSRDTIIGKNNNRRDFEEIWKDEEMEYGMKKNINNYIYIYIFIYILREIMRKY